MSANPSLAVDNTNDVSMDDIVSALEDYRREYDGGDDGPMPEPDYIVTRHQLMHMDFWFITGAMACMLLIMTSFIPMNMFEPLVVAAIVLLFMAVVSNLTREKQGILVHENRTHVTINVRLPRWMGFGYVPANKPLVETIQW